MYVICMKPVTMYVPEKLYDSYQAQAARQEKKAAELIRDAMEEYAKMHFRAKHSLSDLKFDTGVRLAKGGKDFLYDESWQDDMYVADERLFPTDSDQQEAASI